MTTSAAHAVNAREVLARLRDPLAQMLWEARWAGMAAFKEGALVAANPFDAGTEEWLAIAWIEGWYIQSRFGVPLAASEPAAAPPAPRRPYKDD